MTGPRAILVEFVVKPDFVAAARELILTNATASLRDEPGCLRFDVLIAPEVPRRFVLYEVYESPAAFDAHLETAHFAAFAEATDDMFEARTVRELDLISAASER